METMSDRQNMPILLAVLLFLICCSELACAGAAGQCRGGNATLLRADDKLKTFASPNFPRPYPSNSYCQWLIEAPSDHYIVRMDTLAMELEVSQNCIYDSITVYNGKKMESSQLRRFCVGFFTVYTTGRYLLVVFKSDDSGEKRGFQFQYFAVLKSTTAATSTTKPRTTPSTTEKPKKRSGVDKGVLIGGVVGGVCFVIIVGMLCGRCLGGGEPPQPPVHRPAAFYHTHAPPTPLRVPGGDPSISTAVHMVQNNNAVFMVSQAVGSHVPPSRLTSRMSGGVTNVAFDGQDDPPSGISAALGSASLGFLGPPLGVPPPSYADTMLMTNPPVALPPSPGHNPAPPAFPGGGGGLAPAPLYAPRDRNPVSSVSSAGHEGRTFPFSSTESQSHQPVRTTSLRSSCAPANALSTISEESQPRQCRRGTDPGYSFEFSNSVDSASTPTDSTTLTSPSSTLSDSDLPTSECPPWTDFPVTACHSEGRTESEADHLGTSAEWPGEPSEATEFQPSTNQNMEGIAAEGLCNPGEGLTDLSTNKEGLPDTDGTRAAEASSSTGHELATTMAEILAATAECTRTSQPNDEKH